MTVFCSRPKLRKPISMLLNNIDRPGPLRSICELSLISRGGTTKGMLATQFFIVVMGLVLVGSRAGAVSSLFRPTARSDFEESLCEVPRLDHADVPEQLLTFGAQDEQRWHRDDIERLCGL